MNKSFDLGVSKKKLIYIFEMSFSLLHMDKILTAITRDR